MLQEEGLARKLHLDGVPSIVLDGRYLFSGAQPRVCDGSNTARRDKSLRVASKRVRHEGTGQWRKILAADGKSP